MKKSITLKQTALCLALCLIIFCVCDLLVPQQESQVYNSVIRLHIIANSNTSTDQSLKLAVRDAVLAANCFEGAKDMDTARLSVTAAASKAVDTANAVLAAEGVSYRATCLWGRESYPTRVYDGFRLPAGDYLSLRIVLGNGDGENWWCVLFPPLCLGASKDVLNSPSGKVFSVKTKKYSFRFKLLELFFA